MATATVSLNSAGCLPDSDFYPAEFDSFQDAWDSDTAALAGLESLTPANVMHDTNCPGRVFTDKHVRRIQRTY